MTLNYFKKFFLTCFICISFPVYGMESLGNALSDIVKFISEACISTPKFIFQFAKSPFSCLSNTLNSYNFTKQRSYTRPFETNSFLEKEKLEKIQQYLDHNSPDVKIGEANMTPLMFAAKHLNLAQVDLLLKNNANPNISNICENTPLDFVCKSLEELKEHHTDLKVKLEKETLSIIKTLLEHNASLKIITKKALLMFAIENLDKNLVDILLSREAKASYKFLKPNSLTPFQLSIIKFFETKNESENENISCNIIKSLLEQGANANEKVQIYARSPELPLVLAVEKRSKELVNLLLEHGANPNKISDECTAFQIACMNLCNSDKSIDIEIFENLLKYGAKPDYRFDHGPLIMAVANKAKKLVKILLEYKAKIDLVQNGDTPFSIALKNHLLDNDNITQEILEDVIKYGTFSVNIKDRNDNIFHHVVNLIPYSPQAEKIIKTTLELIINHSKFKLLSTPKKPTNLSGISLEVAKRNDFYLYSTERSNYRYPNKKTISEKIQESEEIFITILRVFSQNRISNDIKFQILLMLPSSCLPPRALNNIPLYVSKRLENLALILTLKNKQNLSALELLESKNYSKEYKESLKPLLESKTCS